MINETLDYDLFKKTEMNRPIDESNLNKIILSLKLKNLLQYRPILVNKNMEIIDGQHRLEAAKRLGLPIFYEVEKTIKYEDMILLNSASKRWVAADYINYYEKNGNQDYKKLIDFSKRNNLSLSSSLRVFLGQGGRGSRLIKDGKFKYPSDEKAAEFEKNIERARIIIDLLDQKLTGPKGYFKGSRFLASLVSFLSIKAVDFDLFLNKVNYRMDLVRPCANCRQQLNLFKTIYNWRNKNPIYVEELEGNARLKESDEQSDLF